MGKKKEDQKNGQCTRCGGETRYTRNGKVCERPSKQLYVSKEEERKALDKRTPRQHVTENVFTFMARLTAAMKRQVKRGFTWRWYAKYFTKTGENLFHKFNSGCCDGERVFNYRDYLFFMGWLSNPVYTRLERDGWTIRVEWEDACDRLKNAGDHELVVGYFYDSLGNSPREMPATEVTRADGKAEFTLTLHEDEEGRPLPDDEVVHLYLAFVDRKKQECSRNNYFREREGVREDFRAGSSAATGN